MATNHTVVSALHTIQVLSATTVQDVEYVTCTSVPHGIGYAYAIPREVWLANGGGETLTLIAASLENLVAHAHVVAGSAVQDLDASGLTEDKVELIIQYDRAATGLPPLDGAVSIPVGEILLWESDPSIAEASGLTPPAVTCGQEYDRLKAIVFLAVTCGQEYDRLKAIAGG